MEPLGHAATQVPQPLHSASLICAFSCPRRTRWPCRGRAGRTICSRNNPLRRCKPCSVPVRYSRVDQRHRFGGGGARLRHLSGMSLGPWQQPAMKTPSVNVLTGRQLGMLLQEPAFRAATDVEHPPHRLRVGLRLQPDRQHDHIHRHPAHESRPACPRPASPACLPLPASSPSPVTSATRPRTR